MKKPDTILFCAILGICSVLSTGCQNEARSTEEAEYAEFRALNSKLIPLDKIYFDGDVKEARQSLLKEEDLLKHTKSKRLATIGLELVYARLHTLEMLEGNTNAASLFLEKYKNVYEGSLRDGNVSAPEIAANLNRINSEDLMKFVLKWDQGVPLGGQPRYCRELKDASQSALAPKRIE